MQALSALLRVAILLALLSSKASAIFPGAAIEDILLLSLFCGFKNINGPQRSDSVSAKERLWNFWYRPRDADKNTSNL